MCQNSNRDVHGLQSLHVAVPARTLLEHLPQVRDAFSTDVQFLDEDCLSQMREGKLA